MKSIREEPDVQRAVDEACDRWERAQEAWDALTWVLARDPTVGVPLSETGTARTLTVQGGRSIDMPTITVVYEIEPEAIAIRSALFEDAKAPFVGHA